MLQIRHIQKEYRTGTLVQRALDGVSLNLRDNEFVAILGPSGSGKTTLLNIIGGLDRYDQGDLIINGISTKKYKDRDWDSYRNHTIGFVFQSYNLIPHQTLLSNVELALTISGIGKNERKRRAREALEKVGLGAQVNKRPNQLSGGQMQRVAIARALVNDPEILLADEPTGALDSATSVQVMDLLQEVAKDRLVVMVTHNPELAEQYATRIVTLKDGHILSDTNPYVIETEGMAPAQHKNMGRSSMSFLTALSLSFNNLRTKKARTLLTSFAGSIGIIGIALILALSTGVNDYIQDTEEQTLSEYPLQITGTGMDLTSLLSSGSELMGSNETGETEGINVIQTITSMFSSVDSNDLASLKRYLESEETNIKQYVNAIEYSYDVDPQIYRIDTKESTYRQVNPDQTMYSMGMGTSMAGGFYSSMMSTDSFHAMPANESIYKDQYELKAGKWPEGPNELIVVLTKSGSISDFTMYALGLRDAVELDDMIKNVRNGEDAEVPEDLGTYDYDEILNTSFKLVNAADYYEYDGEYQIWKDKTDDSEYMISLIEEGEDLQIVGIVQPKKDASSQALNSGINYPVSLTEHIVSKAAESDIVKEQLAGRDRNVFTGEPFGEESSREVDLESLFSIDEEAFSEMFAFDSLDLSGLNFDTSDFGGLDMGSFDLSGLDLSGLDLSSFDTGDLDLSDQDLSSLDFSSLDPMNVDSGISSAEMPELDLTELLSSIKFTADTEELSALSTSLIEGFREYGEMHPEADFSSLGNGFREYLKSDTAREILTSHVMAVLAEGDFITVNTGDLNQTAAELLEKYQSYVTANNYDISENPLAYVGEYLQTEDARQYVRSWLDSHITVSDNFPVTDEQIDALATELSEGYTAYAAENSYADPSKMGEYFLNYLETESAQSLIAEALPDMIDTTELSEKVQTMLSEYMKSLLSSYSEAVTAAMQSQITALVGQMTTQIVNRMMSQMMEQLSSQLAASVTQTMNTVMNQFMGQITSVLGDSLTTALAESFSIDPEAFSTAFQFNMDAGELQELMLSMSSSASATYAGNLSNLGYADFDDPGEIDIYPVDFESKEQVLAILDEYNAAMTAQGMDEQVITYTDMVGTLMSSVTDIINMISYVLIAFVGISLVVSSIMIGVITYISVLERQKEIGILRAIGASKRNVSQIFNAETFIIGLFAGLIGVGLAALLTIPANFVIRMVSGVTTLRAALPLIPAAVLVLLSIILTMIGGLLPAGKASRSDPVTALRTD